MAPTSYLPCPRSCPSGQDGPPLIGRQGAADGTTPLELITCLNRLFHFLAAVHAALGLLAAAAGAEHTIEALARLGEQLAGEIQRRTTQLYGVGKGWQERAEGLV